MKNFSILAAFFCLLWITTSYANTDDWQSTYYSTYTKEGVKPAVTGLLEIGKSPEDILNASVSSESIEVQPVLTVLFCLGIDAKEIQNASELAKIDTDTLLLAFEDSVAECGDMLMDDEATGAMMNANRTAMPTPGTSPAGSSRYRYASPSAPQQ